MTDVYAWDSGPSAPPDNDPAASGIFGNDFSSSVAGQITAVFWWRPVSSGHTTTTVQVHLQSDQSLITTEASGTLTAGAVNRIALSSPVTVTTGVKYTISAFLSASARIDFENPSTDRTVSGVTAFGSGGRFKNVGFSVGDYPTSNDPNTGFSLGIEFTPSAAADVPVAVPLGFAPGMLAPNGIFSPWTGIPVFQSSAETGATVAVLVATGSVVKVSVAAGNSAQAVAILLATARKVAVVTGCTVAVGAAGLTARKIGVAVSRGVAVQIASAAVGRINPATGRTVAVVTAVGITGASAASRPAVGVVVGLVTTRCKARFKIMRPNSGTVARPNSGLIARPNTGVIERP